MAISFGFKLNSNLKQIISFCVLQFFTSKPNCKFWNKVSTYIIYECTIHMFIRHLNQISNKHPWYNNFILWEFRKLFTWICRWIQCHSVWYWFCFQTKRLSWWTLKHVLVVLDIASRYKDAEALTSKESKEVAKVFEKIYSRKLKWSYVLVVDTGTEFMGNVTS